MNLKWWLSVFDNNTKGASARKVQGFIAIFLATALSIGLTTEKELLSMVIIWLLFALLCLGIITADQLIRLKLGDKDGKQNEE